MHKGARTDPCGGRGVTRAPTATKLHQFVAPYEAGNGGEQGQIRSVGALWFEVRGLRVLWRAASRNASSGGRASSLGAAERHLVFARACGSGGVEGPPQIQIGHFEFDLVRAA